MDPTATGSTSTDKPRRRRQRSAEPPRRSRVTKVDKPWGHELIWAKTDRYVGKILHIKAGEALSLQYHRVKDETIMVLSRPDAVRCTTPTASRRSRASSRRASRSTSRPGCATA